MPPKKKAPKKGAAGDPELREQRRAFEHRARVLTLETLVGDQARENIHTLTTLAEQQLGAGRAESAADLFRAAEHLSFASVPHSEQNAPDPALAGQLQDEFQKKLEKADKHWGERSAAPELEKLFLDSKARAEELLKSGRHWQALELARAADAMAEVELQDK